MAQCQQKDCTREARAALRTTRPRRTVVKTVVLYDDRFDVPNSYEKLCKQHTKATLLGLVDTLVDMDEG